jgi:hypothetical protein
VIGEAGNGAGQQAPPQPASQEEIVQTALWHLFDFDLASQTYTLMRIEEEIYRQASFLDQRIGSFGCPMVRYELKHLAQMFPRLGQQRGAMGFIFHVGHCGSTLLSRALSASLRVLPLREPMTLRTLSTHQRDLDTPMSFIARPDWEWLLTTILDSLARRFQDGQFNVVKATSTGNNLIVPVLEESDSHRAILLYVPLETYLATMLGKGKEGGDLWGQAPIRMKDWLSIDEQPDFALHELRAPQFAVLSWLTSINHMFSAREKFDDRLMMMDFEDLIADSRRNLTAAASFFGLESETGEIIERFPEISSSYSKLPDRRYTPEYRKQLLLSTRDEHAADIKAGLEWAEYLIDRAPQLEPARSLLL